MKTCLVLFPLFSRISSCSGDMDLDISGVLFLSLSIERPIRRSWDLLVDLDFSRDIDHDILRATGSYIGRP